MGILEGFAEGAAARGPRRWRVPCGLALEHHPVGGSVAVLNVESGDTHLLSRQGADLLERIRREPGVGEGKLAAMVAAGPEGPKMVRAALAELRRLRLVEAVPD